MKVSCSKCNEVKLADKSRFEKIRDTIGIDNYICRDCRPKKATVGLKLLCRECANEFGADQKRYNKVKDGIGLENYECRKCRATFREIAKAEKAEAKATIKANKELAKQFKILAGGKEYLKAAKLLPANAG